MCGHEYGHRAWEGHCAPGHHARRGGCCPPAWGERPWRRMLTREERIARLEAYLEELRAEAKAVEESLAEIKAAE